MHRYCRHARVIILTGIFAHADIVAGTTATNTTTTTTTTVAGAVILLRMFDCARPRRQIAQQQRQRSVATSEDGHARAGDCGDNIASLIGSSGERFRSVAALVGGAPWVSG